MANKITQESPQGDPPQHPYNARVDLYASLLGLALISAFYFLMPRQGGSLKPTAAPVGLASNSAILPARTIEYETFRSWANQLYIIDPLTHGYVPLEQPFFRRGFSDRDSDPSLILGLDNILDHILESPAQPVLPLMHDLGRYRIMDPDAKRSLIPGQDDSTRACLRPCHPRDLPQ